MSDHALGMIEFKSVARGIFATDTILKHASVKILDTHPLCPGKYAIIFSGPVADTEEALKAGVSAAGDGIINKLFLPNVHSSIIPAIRCINEPQKTGSLGIIETFSISTCIIAADAAVKVADVEILEIRLANGLGGKGYFIMTGELHDVNEAFEIAKSIVANEGMLAGGEIIASPHQELLEKGVCW